LVRTADDFQATVQALDRYDELISWVWMQLVNDWVVQVTGEMLTWWEPEQVKDKKLLKVLDWLAN